VFVLGGTGFKVGEGKSSDMAFKTEEGIFGFELWGWKMANKHV
jgi:hypothetical protein